MARKNNKHRQIMRAAEKLFAGKRFHEITMSDVARVAQVGKGTIYQYFTDKDDLFLQTLTSGFDEMCATLHEKVPQDAPFVEQLLSACGVIDGFFAGRKHLTDMLQVEDARMAALKGKIRERWLQYHRKLAGTLGDVIAKGVAEGAVRSDYPPELLASLLLALLKTRARELADAPKQFTSIQATIDLFLRGAGTEKRTASTTGG